MTDPFIPREAGDFITAQDWNRMQIAIREFLNRHTHTGKEDQGLRLEGTAISPEASATMKSLTVTGLLSAKGKSLSLSCPATAAEGLTVQGPVSAENEMAVKGPLQVEGSLRFGAQVRQMIDLWKSSYGIGIQSHTQYYRSAKNFAWYKGGKHNDGQLDPGGGTPLMVIRDGQVGIGTAAPKARLHVGGTAGKDGIMFPDGSIQRSAVRIQAGNWAVGTLSGVQTKKTQIKLTGFAAPPAVSVSIFYMDVAREHNLRISASADGIGKDAFTLKAQSWGDTHFYGLGLSWIAFGH